MEETRKPRLLVIVASVRDGRVGKAVADWFVDFARAHDAFEIEVADLKELDLPLMTEPNHPRLKDYTQEKTWEWSRMVEAADAFAFVMPEYNFAATAPLINALDYLVQEWAYKPVGLVTYGGVSAGLRAAQSIKPLVTTLSMMPIKEAIAIQWVAKQVDDDGRFEPIESHISSGTAMLDALVKWERALSTMRAPESVGATR
ncbi:MAG TPA: NADPH-dependent FMN reductase [Thermomicrobiales bacterium]|nr:NADPH-dependent FMN reductase [Thermomicrobiales bacterium]